MKKFFLLPPILGLVLFLDGCSPAGPANKNAAVPVQTAKAVATNVPVVINPPPVGHVTPVSSVTIRPQIGGVIRRIFFKEGQEVKAGDLLFAIDTRPAQAALEQAKANLQRDAAQMENSRIQFDREQKLFDQKLVSQDEYDTSKAGFDALAGTVAADHAAVTNAELNLEYTSIRSPIDGRTGSLQFHEGNVVKAPDDVLVSIIQMHPVYVVFGVPEQYLPEIQKQMRTRKLKASAIIQDLAGPSPLGELTFVDNSVDPTAGMIQLKAMFPNEDGALWPGQFVHVGLTLSELTNAVVVPSQAVQVGQSGQFIYVVKADQTVEMRPVQTGITLNSGTVVEKGLAAGESVVTDGQLRLAPNAKIMIKSSEATSKTNAP